MKKLLALAVLILAPIVSAQNNTISLSWDASSAATGYRVSYGTASGTYTVETDVGSSTSTILTLPTEATNYFAAVVAYNSAGASGFSQEMSGWPAPETVTVIANCSPIPAGVSCDLAVAGFNYDPLVTASIDYPGLTVISTARLDARSISMVVEIASTATGGDADLVISQPWKLDGVVAGQVVRTSVAAIVVTPVILPAAPGNLRVF